MHIPLILYNYILHVYIIIYIAEASEIDIEPEEFQQAMADVPCFPRTLLGTAIADISARDLTVFQQCAKK